MSGATNGGRANGTASEEPVIGYLSRIDVNNVRSIVSLHWTAYPGPGWNVVLGDNGAGKSTLLRAISYAMLPSIERLGLRVSLHDWIRSGQEGFAFEILAKVVDGSRASTASSKFSISRHGGTATMGHDLTRAFCAGFGPFRRFTGGDAEYEKQFSSIPRVARNLSLFDERVSLTESLSWLKKLRFKELEGNVESAAFLGALVTFINQDGFLPNGSHLDRITSDNVVFVDGNSTEVAIEELSDGYRSILSLVLELIRQLASHYGSEHVFDSNSKTVIAPGIVLIDEVDAHLHPSWQRRIGLFLRACFPAIQFIVTTHSPLVCQAAEVGTVFQLPRPGTSDEGRMVTGAELDRLLYGDLVEAYETEAMGGIGRSDRAKELLGAFAALNRKAIDEGLSEEERKEQRRLRAIFPTSSETLP